MGSGAGFGRVVGDQVRYPDGSMVNISSMVDVRRRRGLPSYQLTDPDPGWFESANKDVDFWGYLAGAKDHGGLNMHPDDIAKIKRQWELNAFADPQEGLKSRLSHSGNYADLSLRNAFVYDSDKFPTLKGSYYDVDHRLSRQALLDQNNPRNKIRNQKVEKLYGYYQQRQEDLKTWREDVEKARDQRRTRMRNTIYMAAAATALSALYGDGNLWAGRSNNTIEGGWPEANKAEQVAGLGSTSGFYGATGGLATGRGFIHRGTGGVGLGSRDDVPAMLMSGEYVMNRDAVNRHGISFFSRLNKGLDDLPHFAEGGYVGHAGIKKNPAAGTDSLYDSASDITNNITINVSVDQNGNSAANIVTGGEQGMSYDQAHGLSEMIKTKVVETIIQQKRQGGLLHSASAGNRTF